MRQNDPPSLLRRQRAGGGGGGEGGGGIGEQLCHISRSAAPPDCWSDSLGVRVCVVYKPRGPSTVGYTANNRRQITTNCLYSRTYRRAAIGWTGVNRANLTHTHTHTHTHTQVDHRILKMQFSVGHTHTHMQTWKTHMHTAIDVWFTMANSSNIKRWSLKCRSPKIKKMLFSSKLLESFSLA